MDNAPCGPPHGWCGRGRVFCLSVFLFSRLKQMRRHCDRRAHKGRFCLVHHQDDPSHRQPHRHCPGPRRHRHRPFASLRLASDAPACAGVGRVRWLPRRPLRRRTRPSAPRPTPRLRGGRGSLASIIYNYQFTIRPLSSLIAYIAIIRSSSSHAPSQAQSQ